MGVKPCRYTLGWVSLAVWRHYRPLLPRRWALLATMDDYVIYTKIGTGTGGSVVYKGRRTVSAMLLVFCWALRGVPA